MSSTEEHVRIPRLYGSFRCERHSSEGWMNLY